MVNYDDDVETLEIYVYDVDGEVWQESCSLEKVSFSISHSSRVSILFSIQYVSSCVNIVYVRICEMRLFRP